MPDVFISYSTADERLARFVHDQLETEGLTAFLASLSLRPGDKWSESIKAALIESEWVIFLASHTACKSPYVQQEFGMALGKNKKIVPIIWDIKPSELPGWMGERQALDLRSASPGDAKRKVLEIAKSIRRKKDIGLLIALAALAGVIWLSRE